MSWEIWKRKSGEILVNFSTFWGKLIDDLQKSDCYGLNSERKQSLTSSHGSLACVLLLLAVFWILLVHFFSAKSILPYFSSPRGVAILDCESHSQAGSTRCAPISLVMRSFQFGGARGCATPQLGGARGCAPPSLGGARGAAPPILGGARGCAPLSLGVERGARGAHHPALGASKCAPPTWTCTSKQVQLGGCSLVYNDEFSSTLMEQRTLDAIGVLIISTTAGGGVLGRLRCNVDSEGGKYTSATPRCTWTWTQRTWEESVVGTSCNFSSGWLSCIQRFW